LAEREAGGGIGGRWLTGRLSLKCFRSRGRCHCQLALLISGAAKRYSYAKETLWRTTTLFIANGKRKGSIVANMYVCLHMCVCGVCVVYQNSSIAQGKI